MEGSSDIVRCVKMEKPKLPKPTMQVSVFVSPDVEEEGTFLHTERETRPVQEMGETGICVTRRLRGGVGHTGKKSKVRGAGEGEGK